jgi:hypothetical protein
MAILTNAQPEVTLNNTVTLTNKTLTAPTISDPTFTGTTTNINTTNLVVEDKNIVINDVTSPTDVNADGGGISLNGDTTKTLNWVDSTDAWTSSENFNVASGKAYYVNGTLLKDVAETLTNKTLTTPVISSITNTGTLTLPTTTGTVALTSDITITGSSKLSAFAATTSSELAGVISDETGSGVLVFGTSPTIGTPTINGGVLDEVILSTPQERTTIAAVAAGTTVNFDAKTQGVLYYTTNSTGDWTLNVRGDGSTTLDSMMTTGDALTIVFMATNSTAYYATALTIDGNAVTPKFQNGVAFASGSASAIDIYSYTIFKTASATFTVLAGQTKFA